MNTLKILLVIIIITGVASWFVAVADEGGTGISSANGEKDKTIRGYSANDEVPVRVDQESIGKGKVLFERLCTHCHNTASSPPKGNVKMRAPGLKGILKEDVLPFSKKPATARNILNQLNKSFDKMPSFHFLSEDEKLNIIAFLNTL